MYNIIFNVFKFIFIVICPFISFGFVAFVFYRFYLGIKGIKGEYKPYKNTPFLYRLCVQFPFRFILDKLTFDPDFFKEFGVHIVAGEQGSGKTMTVVYLLKKYQSMYPKLKVKTNMSYKFEDDTITHYNDVLNSNNGIYGEIDVIDEIQNWFCSMQSKDFPPEMLTEITQQRKQRKMIIGTSQVFTRMAKPLREQTFLLYEPLTLFGCLTVVRVYKPKLDDDGTCKDKKMRKVFFFVQSEDLRCSYDTYKKIEKYKEDGFIPSPFVDSSITINQSFNSK